MYVRPDLFFARRLNDETVLLGFESLAADGGLGYDSLELVDSDLDERLILDTTTVEMVNTEWAARFSRFDSVRATSLADDGDDRIENFDRERDYLFTEWGDWDYL